MRCWPTIRRPWARAGSRRPMLMLSLGEDGLRETTRRRRFSGLRASAREKRIAGGGSRARQDVHALRILRGEKKAGRRFRPGSRPPSQDSNLSYGVTGWHRPPRATFQPALAVERPSSRYPPRFVGRLLNPRLESGPDCGRGIDTSNAAVPATCGAAMLRALCADDEVRPTRSSR